MMNVSAIFPFLTSYISHTSNKTLSFQVVNDFSFLEANVKSFLLNLQQSGETVIGFDAQWSHAKYLEKVVPSRMILCVGDKCLAVHLDNFHPRYHSLDPLSALLRDPKLIFVGMGIRKDLDALGKECGIRYRNAVEIGSLAADSMNDPRLNYCGLDMLVWIIGLLEMKKLTFTCSCISCSDDDRRRRRSGLSNYHEFGQVNTDLAANCYSYYRIGKRLLEDEY